MSAIKFSARIIAAAAMALGLAASCGQLLGDYIVTLEDTQVPGLDPDAAAPPPQKICEVGVTACEGKVLQLCTDDGTAWATLEVCGSPELCESSDVSTVSGCIPATCAVDQMSCDGNMLRLCNVARNGWELFDSCESAAHCDAGAKQCLPAPCEPGDRRCNVGSLEACNETRTGWEQLDTCETNELCEATLAPPATVGEVQSVNQLPPPAILSDPQGRPLECRSPVCVPKEVRCDEAVNPANLIVCNEGQTAFTVAEDCATPKLCQASITYTGLRGSPRCVRPTCAVGEHRCTETGGLELCNVDRDGFDPIEQCIGAPFCNAVAADNGQPGCRDAPCEAGEQQCNGPQILACSADRTQFVATGAPCETRGLCNDDNPFGAFCQAPVCQRGPFSGTEFRCEGTSLLRCNDQHTGYETINTCVTPQLCNASLGFLGCQAPACAPNETRCNGDFVQRCNAARTGFESIERCDPGTCDGTAGRCADPCDQGTARCNAQGNLEECRNPLVGREITARCGSVQLCDAAARTCRQPPAGCTADGVRRCRQQGQNTVLEVCTDGRSRFATLDTCTPGEFCDPNDQQCDVCQQGSGPVCEGNNLATCAANGQSETNQQCGSGCNAASTPDRCFNCVPGDTACDGRQLVVCRTRNGTEVVDREDCDTQQLCQATLASCSGEECRCEESECDPGERRCNGAQPVVCNAGQTGFDPSGPSCGLEQNCNPSTGRCFACAVGDVSCSNGQLFGCAPDRSGFTVPLGTQRCVSDNNGERSQTCDGSTLVNSRCQGSTSECVAGFGCQECDADDFEVECSPGGSASQRVCVGGDVQDRACPGAQGCLAADCDDGACNTTSRPRGAACTRPGGAGPGFCDGLAIEPSCVECVNNGQCDDNNECTDNVCSANGSCQFPGRVGSCNNGAGSCNGQGQCVQCLRSADCDDDNECTTNTCSATGVCQFPATMGGSCDGDGFCRAGACVECLGPGDCNDGNDCTTDTCSAAGACQRAPSGGTCNNGADVCSVTTCVDCLDGVGCDNGEVCQGTTCVAECNPGACEFGCDDQTNSCSACTAAQCAARNDPASCIINVCQPGSLTCTQGNRNGESCGDGLTGTCAGTICNPPELPPDEDPPGGGGGEPPGGGPPGGGNPPGGAGDPPGGGGNSDPDGDGPCDGVCDLVGDALDGCLQTDCLGG
jgi:hypothetical protein